MTSSAAKRTARFLVVFESIVFRVVVVAIVILLMFLLSLAVGCGGGRAGFSDVNVSVDAAKGWIAAMRHFSDATSVFVSFLEPSANATSNLELSS
jgi:hypothetical protein